MNFLYSRTRGARVSDELAFRGLRVVAMENEHLRACVLAGQGADVIELLDKKTGVDLLWRSPQGIAPFTGRVPTTFAEQVFADYYKGCWQEIFPHGSSPAEVNKIQFGQHGEVWGQAWRSDILTDTEAEVAVRFSVRTYRTPFLLERTMRLRAGQPCLELDETVTNLSGEPMEFMWGHHPAFGAPFIDERAFIEPPPGGRLADGTKEDLTAMPPGAGVGKMFYVLDIPEGWVNIKSPTLGRTVRMEWDKRVFPLIWIYQNFGTPGPSWFKEAYSVVVEPFSTLPLRNRERLGSQPLRLEGRGVMKAWLKLSVLDLK